MARSTLASLILLLPALGPVAAGAQGLDFEAPTAFGSGLSRLAASHAGDVDGDGRHDVVSLEERRLRYHRNRGQRRFQAPIELTEHGVFEGPFDVGDVTGDGLADIVAFRPSTDGVHFDLVVLVSLGEAARFRLVTVREGISDVRVLRITDIDADPAKEIIVSAVFAGSGVLSFELGLDGVPVGPPAVLFLGIARAVGFADFSGSGLRDMWIQRNASNPEVEVYPALGDGTFGPVLPTRITASPAEQLGAFGDVNGDGIADLFSVLLSGAPAISVGDGALGFQFTALLPVVDPPMFNWRVGRVSLVDMNGDGLLDPVWGSTFGSVISQFPGGAVFAARSTGGGSVSPATLVQDFSLNRVVDFADLRGTGRPDLLEGPLIWPLPPDVGGGNVAFEEPFFRMTIDAAGDLDGDGDPDLLVTRAVLPAADFRQPGWIEMSGNGRVGDFTPLALTATAVEIDGKVVVADLNGDGELDLIRSGRQLSIFINDGQAASFTEIGPTPFPDPQQRRTVGVTDIDADGDLDITILREGINTEGMEVLVNDGSGQSYTSVHLADLQDGVTEVRLTDIDGDGLPDLVYQRPTGAVFTVEFLVETNLGSGQFAAPTLLEVTRIFRGFTTFDIDGDGDLDMMRAVLSDPQMFASINWQIAPGDGQGSYGPWADLGPSIPWAWDEVRVTVPRFVDLNSDGILDVLTRVVGKDDARCLIGLGGLAFSEELDVLPEGNDVRLVEDLDADGDLDAVTLLPTFVGGARLFRNRAVARQGSTVCVPEVRHLGGALGRLRAFGSLDVQLDQLTLRAEELPARTFGLFVVGTEAVPAPVAALNSVGQLCVSGQLSRLSPSHPGTGAGDWIELRLDLSALPLVGGPVAVQPGDTYVVQAWHRDVFQGAMTSNFTEAVSLTFE